MEMMMIMMIMINTVTYRTRFTSSRSKILALLTSFVGGTTWARKTQNQLMVGWSTICDDKQRSKIVLPMSAFSNSAIWMRLSHFENKLAFRAFWRTEREKNSSHWPRHIKACFPSPTATWKTSKNLLKFTSFYCWKNAWVLTSCQYHIMIVSINGRNHTIEKYKEPLVITSHL